MQIKALLKDIGWEEFIDTPYEGMFFLKRIQKNDLYPLHGESIARCFYVAEGRVKMIFYSSEGRELTWTFERGEWFGMEDLISGEMVYLYDIEGMDEALLLEVPLKKLIHQYKCKSFYSKLLKIMADLTYKVGNKIVLMTNYTHEEIFLKFLQDNDYRIEGRKLPEISELVKINLRTLQRVIKKLEVSGVIGRSQDSIEVVDLERFNQQLKCTERHQ